MEFALRKEIIIKNRFTTDRVNSDKIIPLKRVNKDTFRILILGDSFAQSIGHDYISLLRKDLPEYIDRNSEIINMAFGGMGPYEYLQQLKFRGQYFFPDLVLVNYYVGNDLTDVEYKMKVYESRSFLGKKLKGFKKLLKEKSYLYNYLFSLYCTFYLRRNQLKHCLDENGIYKRTQETRINDAFSLNKELINSRLCSIGNNYIIKARERKIDPHIVRLAVVDPLYLKRNLLIEGKDELAAWLEVKETLLEIKSICKKINSDMLIVITPHCLQVGAENYNFLQGLKFSIDEKMLSGNRPQRLLIDFCNANDIAYIDLLPVFLEAKKSYRTLFLQENEHMNRKAHLVTEGVFLKYLSDKLASSKGAQ